MKKILSALLVLGAICFMSLPANASIGSLLGLVYQDASTPGDGYTATTATKKGSATCTTYFYIVGLGDCSVKAAMKKGGITHLSFYDVYKKNILGYQEITVNAYGN